MLCTLGLFIFIFQNKKRYQIKKKNPRQYLLILKKQTRRCQRNRENFVSLTTKAECVRDLCWNKIPVSQLTHVWTLRKFLVVTKHGLASWRVLPWRVTTWRTRAWLFSNCTYFATGVFQRQIEVSNRGILVITCRTFRSIHVWYFHL